MLARLAIRMFMAPLGFTCGLLAAFVMLALTSSQALSDVALFPHEVVMLGYDMSVNTATIAFFLAPLMAAPAMVALLLSEMFSIRTWTYHALAGAGTALFPWWLLPSGFEGPFLDAGQVLAAGFVGGLVHWAVAGKQAGLAAPADR